jgi:hypothetical protein
MRILIATVAILWNAASAIASLPEQEPEKEILEIKRFGKPELNNLEYMYYCHVVNASKFPEKAAFFAKRGLVPNHQDIKLPPAEILEKSIYLYHVDQPFIFQRSAQNPSCQRLVINGLVL